MTSKQKVKLPRKSKIVVLSAPSGTGKTTIVNELKKKFDNIAVSISYTTRQPRQGETDGIDYYFIDEEQFKKKIEQGFFAEWARVYDYYYGTSKSFIEENLKKNKVVLLTIDTQGALQIKKKYPKAVLIGILPPSIKEQENRLKKRGETPENIRKRLKASSIERKILMEKYDYRLINRDLEKTIKRIISIIEK
ncbi:MAG: guanylate kinase [Candidatus Omnitrophica bacterium]|nr:guanylate kinase [Candidatus Omnitrophota bacterium]